MCIKAKEFAGLEGSNLGAESHFPFYNIYQFVNPNYKRLPHIKCKTVPTSYLRLEKSSTPINILMQTNKFTADQSYTFEVSGVQLEPVSCAESIRREKGKLTELSAAEIENIIHSVCDENPQLRESNLYRFSNTDRLHMCIAAKEAVRRLNRDDFPPVFEHEKVEKAQIFDIHHAIGKQKRVAIKCPSSPSMYLYEHSGNFQLKTQTVRVLVSYLPSKE